MNRDERVLLEQRKVMEICMTRWKLGREKLGLFVWFIANYCNWRWEEPKNLEERTLIIELRTVWQQFSSHLTIWVKYWLFLTCSWNHVLPVVSKVSVAGSLFSGKIWSDKLIFSNDRELVNHHIGPNLSSKNLKLNFQSVSSTVLPCESRWPPKCSWGSTIKPREFPAYRAIVFKLDWMHYGRVHCWQGTNRRCNA